MRLVIPAVNYADLLVETLPAWRVFAPDAHLTVVTAYGDLAARFALDHANALVETDAWTRQVPTENTGGKRRVVFNKALALDEAFGFLPDAPWAPSPGEVCLSVDADVLPFGTLPDLTTLDDETLYSVPRYECPTPAELDAYRQGQRPLSTFGVLGPRRGGEPRITTPEACAAKCLGYFQLFRHRPGRRFGSFRSAGMYDLAFHRHFTRRVGLTCAYVLHLGGFDRRNWTGRVVPPWP